MATSSDPILILQIIVVSVKDGFNWKQYRIIRKRGIVGYYRPVNQWHAGKKEDFKERLYLIYNE